MNKYHISLELPKILLTLSEMTSCEEARLAARCSRAAIFLRCKNAFPKRRLLIYS